MPSDPALFGSPIPGIVVDGSSLYPSPFGSLFLSVSVFMPSAPLVSWAFISSRIFWQYSLRCLSRSLPNQSQYASAAIFTSQPPMGTVTVDATSTVVLSAFSPSLRSSGDTFVLNRSRAWRITARAWPTV